MSRFLLPLRAPNRQLFVVVLPYEQEHNFATSSGSATDEFRSLESCTGYTGEGEEFPTAVSCDKRCNVCGTTLTVGLHAEFDNCLVVVARSSMHWFVAADFENVTFNSPRRR